MSKLMDDISKSNDGKLVVIPAHANGSAQTYVCTQQSALGISPRASVHVSVTAMTPRGRRGLRGHSSGRGMIYWNGAVADSSKAVVTRAITVDEVRRVGGFAYYKNSLKIKTQI